MTNLSSKENEQIGNNRLKGLSFFLYNNVLQKTLLLNTLLIAKNDKEIQKKKDRINAFNMKGTVILK